MKNKTIFWGIITLIIIVAISYAHFFFKEPKPLVIFAGGGSVSNYLDSIGIKVDTVPNSVYINMPSGYVKKLFIEEIKRFGQKSEAKHPTLNISLFNNKIVDWNIESLKPFLFVGLSADSIKYDSLLYSKYTQVFEYYIGEDPLAVYYVVDKNDHQQLDTLKDYDIKKLAEHLRDSNKHWKIYTTSPNSGTRNSYDSTFVKDNKKEELNIIQTKAQSFFDNEIIPTKSIVLSSKYYPPTIDNKKEDCIIKILKVNDTVIRKNLYVYVIGYKSHENIYKPNSQVIDFLNKLYEKKHPDKKNFFSDDDEWRIESSERGKIKKKSLKNN